MSTIRNWSDPTLYAAGGPLYPSVANFPALKACWLASTLDANSTSWVDLTTGLSVAISGAPVISNGYLVPVVATLNIAVITGTMPDLTGKFPLFLMQGKRASTGTNANLVTLGDGSAETYRVGNHASNTSGFIELDGVNSLDVTAALADVSVSNTMAAAIWQTSSTTGEMRTIRYDETTKASVVTSRSLVALGTSAMGVVTPAITLTGTAGSQPQYSTVALYGFSAAPNANEVLEALHSIVATPNRLPALFYKRA